VEVGGRRLEAALPGRQGRLLLAYVVTHRGRGATRDELAAALWPERAPKDPDAALRAVLSKVRTAIAPIKIEGRTALTLGFEDGPSIDVEEAEQALAAAEEALAASRWEPARDSALIAARTFERPFLPGLESDWIEERRRAVGELRLRALECATKAQLRLGELPAARETARTLVSLAPYRESGRRLLMEGLAAGGDVAEALRVYDELRLLLREELGTAPGASVQEIHERLLRGGPALPGTEAAASPVTPPPTPVTPLIGRDAELKHALELLASDETRLLSLTGPGGVGKTRLALAVAADAEADEVAFVSLESVEAPVEVPVAIARAVGLPPTDAAELAKRLGDRSLLVVLDSFERAGAAIPLVGELLSRCPSLRLLVTSRAPLRISGERELPVPPLGLPDLRRLPDASELAGVPAVALFIEQALRIDPRFELTRQNLRPIAETCVALDGLPLAIELAAARVRVLSPEEMVERLEDRLELLSEGPRDLPARQRTLADTIQWSYELLDDGERQLLRRLAVFAGGFGVDAAEAVAEAGEGRPATLRGLLALAEQNLVQRSGDRLRMLDTIRAYALERLNESGERELVRRVHADYFLRFAEMPEPDPREFENVRVALQFSLEQGGAERAGRLADLLARLGPVRPPSEGRRLSRFVGREQPLARLEAALERALGGDGRAIGLVAGPGLGKTRLSHELGERAESRGLAVARAQATADGRHAPFLAAIDMLRGLVGIEEGDSDDAARMRVEEAARGEARLREDVPLLLGFLGIPDPGRPPPELVPEARQRRLLSFVEGLVRTRGQPLVLWFEDLHWLDPSSEPFVAALVGAAADTRTLLLLTFRPEYEAPWMSERHYERLELPPLASESMDDLLRDLLGTDPSLDVLYAAIRSRTGGNPFFAEEVVQSLADAGSLEGRRSSYRLTEPLGEAVLPPTVREALSARIERLSESDRAALGAGAVIGKQVPASLLRRVAESSEMELESGLRSLAAADLVHQSELYPEPEYAFKHPLTHEVAYALIPDAERARLHARAGRGLAELAPERQDELAALIARHWEHAGEPLESARWYRRAGEWTNVTDPAQAARHWRRTRQLAEQAPESREALELALESRRWTLGLAWRLGIPDAEATRLFEEGKALAERLDDPDSLAGMLLSYGTVCGMAGRLEEGLRLCAEGIGVADTRGGVGERLGARAALEYALFQAGALEDALRLCDEGIALTGGDPGLPISVDIVSALAFFLTWRGLILWQLSRHDEATRELDRAEAIAREQDAAEVLCWLTAWRVRLARHARDRGLELERALEAVEFAERSGGAFSRALSRGALGFARLLCGDPVEAVAALERALEISAEGRVGLEFEPWTRAVLSEACLARGDAERAREEAERAVALARERGLALWEIGAQVALARALLGTDGASAAATIEDVLGRALELVEQTGARNEQPFARQALAELARVAGGDDNVPTT
jgi:predicted ATPase/DNA-binding SARP family transcriptional activator/tetratricopeptide (TPR) repeat protein